MRNIIKMNINTYDCVDFANMNKRAFELPNKYIFYFKENSIEVDNNLKYGEIILEQYLNGIVHSCKVHI